MDPDAIYTCLSHDVIAHETTHAVLDGLRHRFLMPGLLDQSAFHEGLADIVALLSVFSMAEVVQSLLCQADLEGRIADQSVTDQELKHSALFTLAEQVGSALKDERGSALRDSITLKPSTRWASDPDYGEPHSRGEILVWIILETLARIWRHRLQDITFAGSVNLARAAEEGATAAQHLLGMCVRAIDCLPPVEFEFPDFLAALLVSDTEMVPDDKHSYREAVRSAFAQWGIQATDTHIADLAQSSVTPIYRNLSYTALRSDTDEVFRFIWENLELLEIDPRFYIHVEHVRPSVRVGPDGMVVAETVAEYIQFLEGTPTGLSRAIGLRMPTDIPPSTRVRVLGGGTIIFDQFGQAKYHHRKDIRDTRRQRRRLNYLINNGMFDGDSLGVSDGMPAGQRFAILHQPDTDRRRHGDMSGPSAQLPILASVRVRMYQVGFGDCFLLSFEYAGQAEPARHILIDFGTRELAAGLDLADIAGEIDAHTGGGPDVVVLTHRHQDHMSGFGGSGTEAIVGRWKPRLVVRSWTEDPRAPADATGPGATTLRAGLDQGRAFARALSQEITTSARGARADLRDLAIAQLANQVALDRLNAWSQGGNGAYVNYGKPLAIDAVVPGVQVHVIGPPTVAQHPAVAKERSASPEYWQLYHDLVAAGTMGPAAGASRLQPRSN